MAENATLNQILEITPFASALVAEDYRIKYMNPIMSESLSFSNEKDPIELPILDFIPETEQEDFVTFLKELDVRTKQKNWKVFSFRDVQGRFKKILLNGINHMEKIVIPERFLVFGLPLSDKELEKNLQQSFSINTSNKYKNIFESATVGITVLDDQFRVEETNQTFANHLGLLREDIFEKPYGQFFIGEAKEKMDNLIKMVVEGNKSYVKDILTIKTQHNQHKILEISFSEMNNENQKTNKHMLLTEDVTDQKDTHAALLQSEKLALTGRLAASLAHEINNPLQTAIGCLGLVEEMLDGDEQDKRVYIKMAMDELERSGRIVKRLRDLNRKADALDKSPVDLQKVLDDVLVFTSNRLYDQEIVPIFAYQGPPPMVMASEDQIKQVFLNLMMNAIDAIKGGGKIYLDIINTSSPKGFEVKVRDTGTGIDQKVMDHLFDPFFTTKEDGIGLGLYICKQIIDGHNGSISVEKENGDGTEFTVWLPAHDASAEEE